MRIMGLRDPRFASSMLHHGLQINRFYEASAGLFLNRPIMRRQNLHIIRCKKRTYHRVQINRIVDADNWGCVTHDLHLRCYIMGYKQIASVKRLQGFFANVLFF